MGNPVPMVGDTWGDGLDQNVVLGERHPNGVGWLIVGGKPRWMCDDWFTVGSMRLVSRATPESETWRGKKAGFIWRWSDRFVWCREKGNITHQPTPPPKEPVGPVCETCRKPDSTVTKRWCSSSDGAPPELELSCTACYLLDEEEFAGLMPPTYQHNVTLAPLDNPPRISPLSVDETYGADWLEDA
jgi:hypothetical protein